MQSSVRLNLDRLLKLRLIVARHGEMDGARWWNTKGVLGRNGKLLLSRGFPKTHSFSQARIAFAVASARSAERFSAVPGTATLWQLPADIEDEFDARWAHWLDHAADWSGFFEALQTPGDDLLATLKNQQLLSENHELQVTRLRRSAEGRAVPLPGARDLDDDTVTLLAGAFARGEAGNPAIPYARLAD